MARDAGADARIEGIASPMPVTEPEPPAPVVFTPCRPGWREAAIPEGLTVCEPFPEPRPTCADHEALFVGEGCRRVGSVCPSGEWPAALPESGVLYVRAGSATAGGIGTLADPFRSLAVAIGAARPGDIIALGKGTHDGAVTIRTDAAIRGACAEETILTDSAPSLGFGVVEVFSGTVSMRDVTVTGPRQGLRFEGSLNAELEDIIIDATRVVGLGVYTGASVTARRMVIRGTTPHDEGDAGRGVGLEDRASIVLDKCVIERNHSEGIAALQNSHVQLTDVLIANTRVADGFGEGLSIAFGSTAEGDGVVIEDNAVLGVFTIFEASSVALNDAIVRGNGLDGVQIAETTRGSFLRTRWENNGKNGLFTESGTLSANHVLARGNGGRGVLVAEGGELELSRARIEGNGGTGLLLGGDAATATGQITDAIVRQNDGASVQIQERANARLARVEMAGSLGTSFVVRGEGSVVTATDLHIHDLRRVPGADPLFDMARGIEIRVGANVTVDRARIERVHQLGVFVEDATATLRDITVSGTTARDDIEREFGRGIEFENASDSNVERVHLEGNRGVALMVGNGSRVTASDVVALDTDGSGLYRLSGVGVAVNGAAELTLSRAILQRNREASISAFERGTVLNASDIVIRDTLGRSCDLALCEGHFLGVGAGSYIDASLSLSRFAIMDSALVGVQVGGGTVDMHDGQIIRSPIGVNVQVDGYDFSRLTEGVEFTDIDRNVDTAVLPIPMSQPPALNMAP